jgi:hypothetical protein
MIDIVSCRLASQLMLPVSTIHAIFIYSLVCSNMIYKKEATFNYRKNVGNDGVVLYIYNIIMYRLYHETAD